MLELGTVRPPEDKSVVAEGPDGEIRDGTVVEALLFGCTTWTPLKAHYNKLRTAHEMVLLRILGAWSKSPNNRIIS